MAGLGATPNNPFMSPPMKILGYITPIPPTITCSAALGGEIYDIYYDLYLNYIAKTHLNKPYKSQKSS